MNQRRAAKSHFTSASRRRTIGRTLFWFALLNLIAVEYLFGNLKDIDFLSRVNLFHQNVYPNSSAKSDLPARPQFQRDSANAVDVDTHDGQKGGLNVTRVPISPIVEFPKPVETQGALDANDIPAGDIGMVNGFDPAESPDKEVNASGTATGPVLRKDPATGAISIGNYKSMTIAGNQHGCLELGRSMLTDIGAPTDKLSVLMTTAQILIVKICANNGSVMITCRGGKIVVSPRRARPDDKCIRAG